MKRLLTYFLIIIFLTLTGGVIYIYREYLGEDSDPALSNQGSPLIYKKVNGVVTQATLAGSGNPLKVAVTYTDMDTKEAASFSVNERYQGSIHIGDTITKDKGEKILLVSSSQGQIQIVPID